MNISGASLRSILGSYTAQSATRTESASSSSGSASTSDTSSAGGAASTDFSDPSQLLSNLQKLKTTDPTKFKQTLTDISKQLNEAASKVGGKDGQQLSSLAGKFADAAKTGDLSGLQPPSGGLKPSGGSQGAYAQGSDDGLAQLLASGAKSASSSSSAADLTSLLNSLTSAKKKSDAA